MNGHQVQSVYAQVGESFVQHRHLAQRQADTEVFLVAQQMLRVISLEGQTEQGRDRRLPVAEAEGLKANDVVKQLLDLIKFDK